MIFSQRNQSQYSFLSKVQKSRKRKYSQSKRFQKKLPELCLISGSQHDGHVNFRIIYEQYSILANQQANRKLNSNTRLTAAKSYSFLPSWYSRLPSRSRGAEERRRRWCCAELTAAPVEDLFLHCCPPVQEKIRIPAAAAAGGRGDEDPSAATKSFET